MTDARYFAAFLVGVFVVVLAGLVWAAFEWLAVNRKRIANALVDAWETAYCLAAFLVLDDIARAVQKERGPHR